MKQFIIFLALLLVGLYSQAQQNSTQVREQTLKLQRLMALIDAFYVDDTVNIPRLTEAAIERMLSELDPHSVYISKNELEETNEPLEGGFFGIGIQFAVMHDTLVVVSVLSGGPSEKVGLKDGDRIVSIDNENIAGIGINSMGVRSRLKGTKGSPVNVGVYRRGAGTMQFRIIRDKIPLHSVDAAYLVNKTIGYICISRFAANTIEEFVEAIIKLKMNGMKDLIVDLQGNGGGYMGAAIGVADNILGERKKIVYTKGPSGGRSDEYATNGGLFLSGRLIILIDGGSASASEILAGAIQDWDRGVIVGRRSFGKGLVQKQFPLTDGSVVRLTTAHYFTPSGRCIQKPYRKNKNYNTEIYERYRSGELLTSDSIHVDDSQRFYTLLKKRPVYGGGGIIPDVFVSIDTTVNYLYYNHLLEKSVISQYINNYVDTNRDELKLRYPNFKIFKIEYNVPDAMIQEIVAEGEKAGIVKDEKLLAEVYETIKLRIKANIAMNLWSSSDMYEIMNEDNRTLLRAIQILQDGSYEKILK